MRTINEEEDYEEEIYETTNLFETFQNIMFNKGKNFFIFSIFYQEDEEKYIIKILNYK